MNIITIAEIVVSLALIGLVLIQERSSGAGGIFGASGESSSFQTRRGIEKAVYWATIVAAVLFAGLAIISLTLPK